MLQLVDEIFSTRTDPDQLQVDEKVIARLQQLHPATLSEHNVNGPVVWILIIPTISELMEKFLSGKISEQELFEQTKPDPDGNREKFDCIYLCSASVLPEYRNKGLAKKLTIAAIQSIQKDFQIKTLFVWPFTKEGNALAEKIAEEVGMELKKKSE